MNLEKAAGLGLIGIVLFSWWKQQQISSAAAAAGLPSRQQQQQLPGFKDAFGTSTNAQFTPGGSNSPFAAVGKGGNVGPGQNDESASASPFVYINTSQNFPSGCSTHLWDRKPLCE